MEFRRPAFSHHDPHSARHGGHGLQCLWPRYHRAFESLILSVPLVSPVYGVVKQTLESIRSMRDSGNFRRVAYIKYPEGNGLLVGFVTGQCYDPAFDKEFTLIFLPLTPNPASGRVIAVPGEEGIASGLTVEQVMKIVLSGGGWWHPHGRRTRSPNKFRGLFEQTHPTLRLMRKDLVSP